MKKVIFAAASILAIVSCGSNGQTTWTISNLQVVSDACETNDPADPLTGTFDITIDGSNFTFAHTALEIEGSSSTFTEQANSVDATKTFENTEFSPCVAKTDDTFTITVADSNRRLDNNDTLTVVWNHVESDASATAGACNSTTPPLWFVDLPCTTQQTFTLTKVQ